RGPREPAALSLCPSDLDQGERLPATGGEAEGRWLQRAQRRPRHLLSKPWAPERFSPAVRCGHRISTFQPLRKTVTFRDAKQATLVADYSFRMYNQGCHRQLKLSGRRAVSCSADRLALSRLGLSGNIEEGSHGSERRHTGGRACRRRHGIILRKSNPQFTLRSPKAPPRAGQGWPAS